MGKLISCLLLLATLEFAAGTIPPACAASAAVATAVPAPAPVPTQFTVITADDQWHISGSRNPPMNAQWFKLVLDKTQWIDVDTLGENGLFLYLPALTSTRLRIYRSDDGQTLTYVAKDAKGGEGHFAHLVLRLAPATYYIKVESWNNQHGYYSYKVTAGSDASFVALKMKNWWVETYERTVPLVSRVYGLKPKYYQASEKSDFKGAKWMRYASEVRYTFSSGNGAKKLFFRVKDDKGRLSATVSRSIELNERFSLTLGRALSSAIKTDLETKVFAFTIKKYGGFEIEITPQTKTDFPQLQIYDYALVGPGHERADLDARECYGAARFGYNLGAGTYYVLVTGGSMLQDWYEGTYDHYTGPFSIKVTQHSGPPTVYNFHADIASQAPFVNVAGRPPIKIPLSFKVLGTPREYVANETGDFNGVAWQPYTRRPVFTLSPGGGDKTIYFKVRDKDGRDSAVVSTWIYVHEPTKLELGDEEYTVSPDEGKEYYFIFTVPTAGRYVVDVSDWDSRWATLQFSLHEAISGTRVDPDRQEHPTPVIRKIYSLQPGSYLIHFDADYMDPEFYYPLSSYSVRVYEAQE